MRAAASSPTVFLSADHVVWSLGRDATFTAAFGPGLSRVGLSPSALVGQPITEVYAGRDDIIGFMGRVLSGLPCHETMEFGGQVWRVEATPMRDALGNVVGACGVSSIIRPEPPDVEPGPREREWLVTDVPPRYTGRFRPGDRFLQVDGVPGISCIGNMSDADFYNVIAELGDGLSLVRDTISPQPLHRAHLRHVRGGLA